MFDRCLERVFLECVESDKTKKSGRQCRIASGTNLEMPKGAWPDPSFQCQPTFDTILLSSLGSPSPYDTLYIL